MREREASKVGSFLFLIGCATFGSLIGLRLAQNDSIQKPLSAKVNTITQTITITFTSSEFGLLPRTPPLALGVYDVLDKNSRFDLLDYDDPIPLYRTLFVPLHTTRQSVLQFNPETDETFVFDELTVTYALADSALQALTNAASISSQPSNNSPNPIPETQYDLPPRVAILNQTGVELMDRLQREVESTGREIAEPIYPKHGIRPGIQNAARRPKMMRRV